MLFVDPTEATVAAMPLLLNSYIRTQEQHYRGPRQAIRLWLRKGLLETLERENSVALVANDDGVALGCLVAARESNALVVAHLYTKAAYRRSQVASQLLGFACSLPGVERLAYTCRTFRAGKEWAERLGAERRDLCSTPSQEEYVAHYSGSSGVHRERSSGR